MHVYKHCGEDDSDGDYAAAAADDDDETIPVPLTDSTDQEDHRFRIPDKKYRFHIFDKMIWFPHIQ